MSARIRETPDLCHPLHPPTADCSSRELALYLARFVFEPGSEIFPHNLPGTAVLGVESGTWGWTLLEGTAHVVRGAAAGNTEVEDITEPGIEVLLEVGDAIYYEEDVVHTAGGAGDDETVVWASGVLTAGEPLLMPVDMEMAPGLLRRSGAAVRSVISAKPELPFPRSRAPSTSRTRRR